MKEYEFVHASQVFDDDNGGLVYGINWIDKDGEIIDCEWFKTEKERKRAVFGFVGVE